MQCMDGGKEDAGDGHHGGLILTADDPSLASDSRPILRRSDT